LNMEMWDSYKTAFETVNGDKGVRVVVVSGEGKHLSTGMDLSVFQQMDNLKRVESCPGRQREGLKNVIQYFQDCISAPEKCPVPVVACITGYCIGGGVDLITACDLRYCTADASFCIKETELAIVSSPVHRYHFCY
jgi:enoyl-CoA hydratase/carnithine racemase